jgi:hypothetical protein
VVVVVAGVVVVVVVVVGMVVWVGMGVWVWVWGWVGKTHLFVLVPLLLEIALKSGCKQGSQSDKSQSCLALGEGGGRGWG